MVTTMANAPVWITEKDVVELVSLPDAIEALKRTLILEAGGGAENLPKTHLMVASNDAMHAIGAAVAGAGICGFKTWVNIRGKSETTITLFSLDDGACLAVVEATALGQMRTAAMTGVGTSELAPGGADEMGIVGTGKQSLPQIAAVHAVRPLRAVRVASRNPDTRETFAETVTARLGIPATPVGSVGDAVRDAPIVTLITNSTDTFLSAGMLAAGSHLNAMGAIVPARREFAADVFDRAGAIVVDSLRAVRDLSSEFRGHFGDDDDGWCRVRTISSVVASGEGRPAAADVTLFKAMGMGISDLALAIEVLERARAAGRGQAAPERIKLPPRLAT